MGEGTHVERIVAGGQTQVARLADRVGDIDVDIPLIGIVKPGLRGDVAIDDHRFGTQEYARRCVR